jgi:succinate-semialdehyde dehydrogenase/glutarate-semialdehyde dehydrogenase
MAGAAREFRAVVDPRTGAVLREVPLLAAAEVPGIAATAAAAAAGWAATPLADRVAAVTRFAAELERRSPELAGAYSQEHGKTRPEATAELARAVETIRWAAAAAGRLLAPAALPAAGPWPRRLHLDPAGPVLAIVPWNFPAVVLARKLAPALVVGCPVAVKAAEETPAVATGIVEAAAAGLPDGVLQLVFAAPAESEALVRRPEFRHVTFTGSTAVGCRVAAAAAEHLTPCTLELSAHAPAIVTATADLPAAANALAAAKFGSAGQSCSAPSRLLVHTARFEEFLGHFAAAAPPLEGPDTPAGMGPLNSDRRRGAVHALVGDAVRRGAGVVLGGALPAGPGWYYPATILRDVPAGAQLRQQEPFGPVAAVLPYTTEDEAVAIANETRYALTASVFGAEASCRALARRLDAGSVSINCAPGAAADAPLGGRRASGYGYEGGDQGLLSFTRRQLLTG